MCDWLASRWIQAFSCINSPAGPARPLTLCWSEPTLGALNAIRTCGRWRNAAETDRPRWVEVQGLTRSAGWGTEGTQRIRSVKLQPVVHICRHSFSSRQWTLHKLEEVHPLLSSPISKCVPKETQSESFPLWCHGGHDPFPQVSDNTPVFVLPSENCLVYVLLQKWKLPQSIKQEDKRQHFLIGGQKRPKCVASIQYILYMVGVFARLWR